MSLDDVTRFLDQVVSDPLSKAAMDAAVKEEGDVPAVAVALGQQHGLVFTEEEFVRAVAAARRQDEGSLSDEELAQVSGGFNPQPTPPGSVRTSSIPSLPDSLHGWAQKTF
jgi:predicted ribosomally synthesized peptide with nif11-like leader